MLLDWHDKGALTEKGGCAFSHPFNIPFGATNSSLGSLNTPAYISYPLSIFIRIANTQV